MIAHYRGVLCNIYSARWRSSQDLGTAFGRMNISGLFEDRLQGRARKETRPPEDLIVLGP